MGLFTPGIKTVFANRWKAVWWSAGILATAYCTAQGLPDDREAAEIAQKVHAKTGDHPHPKNPWALDKPDAAGK